jgi:hypothetical protein
MHHPRRFGIIKFAGDDCYNTVAKFRYYMFINNGDIKLGAT